MMTTYLEVEDGTLPLYFCRLKYDLMNVEESDARSD